MMFWPEKSIISDLRVYKPQGIQSMISFNKDLVYG